MAPIDNWSTIMSAEKIAKEFKFSLETKGHNKDKFMALKKAIMKTQKELELSDDVGNFFSFFCDKVAEGKKISIVEETDLWNITKAAKILGVTRPTIYKMVERGDLEGVEFEGLKIVPSSAVAFLKRRENSKSEAMKKMHEIDMKFNKETRELVSNTDDDDFEEIDL